MAQAASSPDAFERAVIARQSQPAPDAFERAVARHSQVTNPTYTPGDRIVDDSFRDTPSPIVAALPVSSGNGFAWSDFAIGVGVSLCLGLVLLLGALGAAAIATRQHRGQLSN